MNVEKRRTVIFCTIRKDGGARRGVRHVLNFANSFTLHLGLHAVGYGQMLLQSERQEVIVTINGSGVG